MDSEGVFIDGVRYENGDHYVNGHTYSVRDGSVVVRGDAPRVAPMSQPSTPVHEREASHGGRILRALVASFAVMAVLFALLPAEEWDKPSLADHLQLSAPHVVTILAGFFCLMFALTTLIHWREVREWHRGRLLERACARAGELWHERRAYVVT